MGTDPVALKFFSDDREYEKGLSHYAYQFQESLNHHVCGEKSVSYMDWPDKVPSRIHKHFPDMKLLFILRNPVDRAFSQYRYSCQHGIEQMSFTEALVMENYRETNTPAPLRLAKPWSYTQRGMYAKWLEPFYKQFDKQNILVVFSEELYTIPEAVSQMVFRFIGLPPHPVTHAPRVNVHTDRLETHVTRLFTEKMSMYEKKYLFDLFEPWNNKLEELLGRSVPDFWRMIP
jgi:hypothetical protein